MVGGSYLKDHDIMADHYSVINLLARKGGKALTPEAELKLQQVFGDKLLKGAPVVGSFELLGLYPDLSAKHLRIINDNIKPEKLAGGAYVTPLVCVCECARVCVCV